MSKTGRPEGSSQTLIAAGGVAIALAVGGALFYLRFCGAVPMPERPPQQPIMQVEAEQGAREVGATQKVYIDRLARDSRAHRVVPAATLESMSRPFEHQRSNQRIELSPGGDPVEVAGLRLKAIVKDRTLGLRIENLADHPVAYRVESRPERGIRRCGRKVTWHHDAMALRERGHEDAVAVRSECDHRRGKGLIVTEIETLELEPLSYFYVSRLQPGSVGLDGIAVRGHRPAEGTACSRALSATLERQIEDGETTWRDLVDFYARHSCGDYRFPSDYNALTDGSAIELPAVRPE